MAETTVLGRSGSYLVKLDTGEVLKCTGIVAVSDDTSQKRILTAEPVNQAALNGWPKGTDLTAQDLDIDKTRIVYVADATSTRHPTV